MFTVRLRLFECAFPVGVSTHQPYAHYKSYETHSGEVHVVHTSMQPNILIFGRYDISSRMYYYTKSQPAYIRRSPAIVVDVDEIEPRRLGPAIRTHVRIGVLLSYHHERKPSSLGHLPEAG